MIITTVVTKPQMLKKSGINQGKHNELPGIHRPDCPCLKQSAVKPRDAIGGKEEEPALTV